jgi:hypothetical protein
MYRTRIEALRYKVKKSGFLSLYKRYNHYQAKELEPKGLHMKILVFAKYNQIKE